MTGRGLDWAEFSALAPDLADDIGSVIERHRFAFVGTIRTDGTPRISAVETHLVGGDLMLVMLPKTRKAIDVRRDDRVTLQSPILDAANPGGEFKLRGRAPVAEDEERRTAAADAIENRSGWRPRPSWLFLAVLLTDATYTTWRPDGTAAMTRWTVERGVVTTADLSLDWETGGYRVE